MKLDPAAGYVACVERIARHLDQWLESRERLPDLKFWSHGRTMVGAAIEPLTWGLIARSDDALDLVKWIAELEPQATVFMLQVVLGKRGFLAGAPELSVEQIKARVQGIPVLEYHRGQRSN